MIGKLGHPDVLELFDSGDAVTLIIRAIALGEVILCDGFMVFQRELLSGLLLGTVLGLIVFLRITVWSSFSDIYGEHCCPVALTAGFALVGIVWGILMSSMLPFIRERVGADRATSSLLLVATLVDVTGLIIDFNVAYVFLRGALL